VRVTRHVSRRAADLEASGQPCGSSSAKLTETMTCAWAPPSCSTLWRMQVGAALTIPLTLSDSRLYTSQTSRSRWKTSPRWSRRWTRRARVTSPLKNGAIFSW
jgi:hypothetical protein